VRVAISLAGFSHEAPIRARGTPFTITVTPDGRARASQRRGKTGAGRRIERMVARALRTLGARE
jgi:hypothetical protein